MRWAPGILLDHLTLTRFPDVFVTSMRTRANNLKTNTRLDTAFFLKPQCLIQPREKISTQSPLARLPIIRQVQGTPQD